MYIVVETSRACFFLASNLKFKDKTQRRSYNMRQCMADAIEVVADIIVLGADHGLEVSLDMKRR